MESRNAPLVRQLFALLQEVLAIASALQDNDDPIALNTQQLLGEQLNRIRRQIDTAAEVAFRHSMRGGSWYYHPGDCRSAYRIPCRPVNANNFVGFRVVCLPQIGHAIRLEEQTDA